MGKSFLLYFESNKIKKCRECGIHITKKKYIVSKKFRGDTGPGFLTSYLINIKKNPEEKIEMNSGVYIIAKVNCLNCNSYIGWKYIKSYKSEQKFKEGKYIIEKKLLN